MKLNPETHSGKVCLRHSRAKQDHAKGKLRDIQLPSGILTEARRRDMDGDARSWAMEHAIAEAIDALRAQEAL